MKNNRVVVAMSGGVDSSVAAALLKKQGYEVIGVTMCFSAPGVNPEDIKRKKPGCCGLSGVEDARRVAHKLGIRHYVLNMQKALEEYVIGDFCQQYLEGRTPNPCVRCNQYLKFGILLKKALAIGAAFIATGHYAKVTKTYNGYQLKKAKDLSKDQSYFLYRLSQSQLKHILFPLANYKKEEVRRLAAKFHLAVADKAASQEICFLPKDNYRIFLSAGLKTKIKPGLVVDQEGRVLGQHQGIAYYTIGQREGLRIAMGYPIYVTAINHRNNQIIVGKKEDVLKREFLVKDVHFLQGRIKKKVALKVRIRYNHKEMPAEITPLKDKIRVKFKKRQFAITPGQAAVFYDRDQVVGGGIIDEVYKLR